MTGPTTAGTPPEKASPISSGHPSVPSASRGGPAFRQVGLFRGTDANPVAEIAGLPADPSDPRTRHLLHVIDTAPAPILCPYKAGADNGIYVCTKDSVTEPLPMCSLVDHKGNLPAPVITCPTRFMEGGTVFAHIEQVLLPAVPRGGKYVWKHEHPLRTVGAGNVIGKVDYVGAVHDGAGITLGVVTVEVQATYATGSPRKAFERLTALAETVDELEREEPDWKALRADRPEPDFLSSWKRLAQQTLSKGAALNEPTRPDETYLPPIRQVVVVDRWFYSKMRLLLPHLNTLRQVEPFECDFAFVVCDLAVGDDGVRVLTVSETVYTTYETVRALIVEPVVADRRAFIGSIGADDDAFGDTLTLF